jgi:hypothetical protein
MVLAVLQRASRFRGRAPENSSQASIYRSGEEEGVAPIRRGVSRTLDDARHRVRSIVVLAWAVVEAVASR